MGVYSAYYKKVDKGIEIYKYSMKVCRICYFVKLIILLYMYSIQEMGSGE